VSRRLLKNNWKTQINIYMSETLEFIKHDFNLPNHDNELSKAEDVIEKLKNRLKIIEIQRTIDDKTHTQMFEHVVRILDYVGRLSMPAFAIEDEMEEMYKMKFLHAPELGKKLWLDHYGNVHHPYNLLKNRCYKLLEELDAEYFKRHKKKPPNWNP
jgi:hypothetical protein